MIFRNVCYLLTIKAAVAYQSLWSKLFFIAILIILTIIVTSCAEDGYSEKKNEENNRYTIYPVAGLVPLSDDFSDYGKPMEIAARLAEDDVNMWLEDNDREWRLKLEVLDTQHFGPDARERMQEWHEKGVDFFIGPTSSESVRSCFDYSNDNKLLMISPSANLPELAQDNDFFYTFNVNINDQAQAIIAAAKDVGVKHLVIVHCNKNFIDSLQQELAKFAERHEIEVSQRRFIFDCSNTSYSKNVIELESHISELVNDGMAMNEIGIGFMATGQCIELLTFAAESETLKQLFWFGNNLLVKSGELIRDDSISDFTSAVSFISPKKSIVDLPAASKNEHLRQHLDHGLDEDIELLAYNTYDIIWSLALSLDQGGYKVENVNKLLASIAQNWTSKYGASGHVVLDKHGYRVNADYDYWAINKNMSWQKIGSFVGQSNTANWQSVYLDEMIEAKREQVTNECSFEAAESIEYDESFEKRYANDDTFKKHRFEERGNTVGNIVYGGTATEQGLWIYYRNSNDNGYLYKMRSDKSSITQLNNDNTRYINVIGGWVYYSNRDDGDKLYKIRVDGTDRTRMTDHPAINVTVIDDWIYYRTFEQCCRFGERIVKMPVDGGDKTTIIEFEDSIYPGYVNVTGGWVYYSHVKNACQFSSGSLFRVSTDGQEKAKGLDGRIMSINALGDWVYFYELLEGAAKKVRPDGSEKSALKNVGKWLNVGEDWVYSVKRYENEQHDRISKIQADGSGYAHVTDEQFPYGNVPYIRSFNIAGGWIFFHSHNEQYRMRTDGSSLQVVE